MKPDPIESIQEAVHRHSFEDGINEILVGVLVAGGALTLGYRGGVFFVLALALLLKWALPRLRDRIAAPRVGMAELPAQPARQMTGIVVYCLLAGLVVVAAWLATGRSRSPLAEYRWVPLFTGLCLSGGFIYAAGRTRLKRFYIYLAATLAGGLLVTLTMSTGGRQEAFGALAQLLWMLSALLIVMGSVILIRFIRRNPVISSEADGSGAHGR